MLYFNGEANLNTKKILLGCHLSPPVHGAGVIGDMVVDVVKNENVKIVKIPGEENLSHIGRLTLKKIFYNLIFIVKFNFFSLISNEIYYTPSPYGFALKRDFLSLILAKLLNKKVTLHLHSRGFSSTISNPINKFFVDFIFSRSNVIFLSEWHKSDLPKENFNSINRSFVVNNSISSFHKYEDKKKEKNEYNFLFLSNLIESKGVFTAIDFCEEFARENKNIRVNLRLVGAYPSESVKENIKNYINKETKCSNVFLIGPKYGDDKVSEFKHCHYLLFPTKYDKEVFPLVVLEAMSFGIPPIVSNHASLPEMVSEEFGYVLDFNKESCRLLQDKLIKDDYFKLSRVAFNEYKNKYTEDIFYHNIYQVLIK